MESEGGFFSIQAPAKEVGLPDRPKSLTLEEIRSRIGMSLFRPQTINPPPPPEISIAEVEEFRAETPSASHSWWFWPAILGSVVTVGMTAAVLRSRIIASTILLLATLSLGCQAKQSDKPLKLSLRFEPNVVLVNGSLQDSPQVLNLEHHEGPPVTIKELGGRCACTVLDKSRFPIQLAAGMSIAIPVTIRKAASYEKTQVTFDAQTERGPLVLSAEALFLPRLKIIPSDIYVPQVFVGEEHATDLTVRCFIPSDEVIDSAILGVSNDSDERIECISDGPVAEIQSYGKWRLVEQRYSVSVKGTRLGHNKALLSAKTGNATIPCSLEWNCVPDIYFVPDKVLVGTRPQLVFMRSKEKLDLKQAIIDVLLAAWRWRRESAGAIGWR
jgi:hypothetical protein